MTRPAPTDVVGSLAYIMEQLDELRRERDQERLTASEAARAYGFNDRYFHNHPWRVPQFGQFGTMHTREVWDAWMARPEIERRAEWDAMDAKTRQQYRGQV